MANTLYQLAGQLGVDMLLPASFWGTAFDCLYTREVLARDTVVYEYPWRDGAEVEDHGLKALNLRLCAILGQRLPDAPQGISGSAESPQPR